MERTPDLRSNSDEIDLFELAQHLWNGKWLIIGLTTAGVALSAIYSFTTTPIYQTTSILRPPLEQSLSEINNTKLLSISPDESLKRIGAELESYSARRNFLESHQPLISPLLSSYKGNLDQILSALNEHSFKTLRPDPKKNDNLANYIGIQFDYPDKVDGPSIVNEFISEAEKHEINKLKASFEKIRSGKLSQLAVKLTSSKASYQAKKDSQIAELIESDNLQKIQLKDELSSLRKQLKEQRNNRIAELNEAIQIAEKLGITKPSTLSSIKDSGSEKLVSTEINNQQLPLYFMGTAALEAERAVLRSRKSDDFSSPRISEINKSLKLLEHNRKVEQLNSRKNEELFYAEIDKLKAEEARLKTLNPDWEKIKLVQVDQPAIMPLNPIKPKKSLIIAVSGLLGLMLGSILVLIKSAYRKNKDQNLSLKPLIASNQNTQEHILATPRNKITN